MKTSLPGTAKVSKDAKECVQECVSEFISFIVSSGDHIIRGQEDGVSGSRFGVFGVRRETTLSALAINIHPLPSLPHIADLARLQSEQNRTRSRLTADVRSSREVPHGKAKDDKRRGHPDVPTRTRFRQLRGRPQSLSGKVPGGA